MMTQLIVVSALVFALTAMTYHLVTFHREGMARLRRFDYQNDTQKENLFFCENVNQNR